VTFRYLFGSLLPKELYSCHGVTPISKKAVHFGDG